MDNIVHLDKSKVKKEKLDLLVHVAAEETLNTLRKADYEDALEQGAHRAQTGRCMPSAAKIL